MPLTRRDAGGVVATGFLPLVTHMTPYTKNNSTHFIFDVVKPDFFALRECLFFPPDVRNFVRPLGLYDFATVEVWKEKHFSLFCPSRMPLMGKLKSVKVSIPHFTDCFNKKLGKAIIASHRCLGRNGHLVPSPYKPDCELSQELLGQYDSAISAIKNQVVGTLRFEYVFDTVVSKLVYQDLQLSITRHLSSRIDKLTKSIPVAEIPFHLGVDQALEILKSGSQFDLAKIVCAESYIANLFGQSWVHLDGLLVAVNSNRYPSGGAGCMPLPHTPDFSHVKWENLDLVKLARQVTENLNLFDDLYLSYLLLTRLSELGPTRPRKLGGSYEGLTALYIVVDLMSMSLPENVGQNLFLGWKTIIKPMTISDWAKCLLYPRGSSDPDHRGLHLCMVLSHLFDHNPNFTNIEKQARLEHLLSTFLEFHKDKVKVWPLAEPIYPVSTLVKFGRLTYESDESESPSPPPPPSTPSPPPLSPPPPPPVSPPPPPPAPPHHSALQPRVPTGRGGRRHHRSRFSKPRIVRDESLPDSHRRRPRNRQI